MDGQTLAPRETICMNYQSLFTVKTKKTIIILSSVVLAHRLVNVNIFEQSAIITRKTIAIINPGLAEPGYTLPLQWKLSFAWRDLYKVNKQRTSHKFSYNIYTVERL